VRRRQQQQQRSWWQECFADCFAYTSHAGPLSGVSWAVWSGGGDRCTASRFVMVVQLH
jgi:hypothetical protein